MFGGRARSLPPKLVRFGGNRAIWCGNSVFKAGFGLVEAAGVEPASEAVSPGISTSVSRILVLAWRLLLTGSASASCGGCPASRPQRPRGGNPVFCDAAPWSAGLTRRNARDLSPGAYVSTAYAARAKAFVLLAFVNAALYRSRLSARNPEAQLPRRDRTPPRS